MKHNDVLFAVALLTVLSILAGCVQTPAPEDGPNNEAPVPTIPATVPILPSGAKVALSHDDAMFWQAPPLKDVQSSACLTYDAPIEPTVEYEIDVPAGTKEYRVALEKTLTETCMRFELVDPSGVSLRAPQREVVIEGIQSYSSEAILQNPTPGPWRVEVFADGAIVELRLRALARTQSTSTPEPDVIQLPDLRPAPPWELKLDVMPQQSQGSAPAVSCNADETVQNGDLSACLRFSFATANIGQGRFELHYSNLAVPASSRDATQWMYAPNGRHEERPAGQVSFHRAHGHYHWDGAYRIQLYRIEADGSATEAGLAFKRTACMFDYFLGDWTRFDQWRMASADASNGCYGVPFDEEQSPPVTTQEWIGLTPGWGDVYWWNLPDNYVKFDGRDGTYLLRFEVDPQDGLLETDETNNSSYVTFQVDGTQITVTERGYGRGPEDPGRSIVEAPWIT
jgi:hypothetical protein